MSTVTLPSPESDASTTADHNNGLPTYDIDGGQQFVAA